MDIHTLQAVVDILDDRLMKAIDDGNANTTDFAYGRAWEASKALFTVKDLLDKELTAHDHYFSELELAE